MQHFICRALEEATQTGVVHASSPALALPGGDSPSLRSAGCAGAGIRVAASASVASSSLSATSVGGDADSVRMELLKIAQALIDYVDAAAASDITQRLTALYEALPAVR